MEYTPFGMGDMADFRVKDMLATLKDHYVGKSGVAANIQLSRLYGLRARNGEDIKLLLTKMDGCFDALADQDMAKGDREKVAAFLAKLKDLTGWESFRLDLSRKGKGVTWHQVKSMAAAYDESRRLDQAESGRAGWAVRADGWVRKEAMLPVCEEWYLQIWPEVQVCPREGFREVWGQWLQELQQAGSQGAHLWSQVPVVREPRWAHATELSEATWQQGQ